MITVNYAYGFCESYPTLTDATAKVMDAGVTGERVYAAEIEAVPSAVVFCEPSLFDGAKFVARIFCDKGAAVRLFNRMKKF